MTRRYKMHIDKKILISILSLCVLTGGVFAEEVRKLYIRCNASFWAPGYANDSAPINLFDKVAEWGGHPKPVPITYFNPYPNYAKPAFPGVAPAGEDPADYYDYSEIIADVSNALDHANYAGETIDFILYSSHSTYTTDELGGAGTEDELVTNSIGWGQVGQHFNPKSRLIIYEPWPYHYFVPGTYASLEAMGDDYHAVAQRAQGAVASNLTAGTARLVSNPQGWEARNWDRKLYRVLDDGTVDKHAGDFGHVIATLMTYAQVYSNSASAIYRNNPDSGIKRRLGFGFGCQRHQRH